VPRPHLERPVAAAQRRRLTTLVGGIGFGKSTLAEVATRHLDPAWYALTSHDQSLGIVARGIVDALRLRVPALPSDLVLAAAGTQGPDADHDDAQRADAYAALLGAALDDLLDEDLLLVVDGLHQIEEAPAALRLVEGILRQAPRRLHILVISRRHLPFHVERLEDSGQLFEITGPALAFSVEETAALLGLIAGPEAAELADSVQGLAGGWPIATRMTVEMLRRIPVRDRAASLRGWEAREMPLLASLTAQMLADEPEETQRLLATLAHLDEFNVELCEELGFSTARTLVADLLDHGIYLSAGAGPTGHLRLNPLVRREVLSSAPLPADSADDLQRRAARWHALHGDWMACLELHITAGHHDETVDLLARHGDRLLTEGHARALVRAAMSLPPASRTAEVERIEGRAREILGDWEGALACFRHIVPAEGSIAAGDAWRIGLIHHLRGDLDLALATYERGRTGPKEDRTDVALLLAWHAAARWLRGEVHAVAVLAAAALEAAGETEDDRALAAAHTVAAMVCAFEGDRAGNEMHYLRALDHAERARDVLQTIRIHVNRASHHTEEGRYTQALSELEIGLRLADLAGFASFRALALSNAGEAKLRLGRLEEAVSDLVAARSIYERLGSHLIAYPLVHLGTVHRERGERSLARACYEEAIEQARHAGDLQGLVPALTGLARLLRSVDSDSARRYADEAVRAGPVLGHAAALLARGWVAAEDDDRELAAELVERAAAVGRRRRDPMVLAESLELEAALGRVDKERMEQLDEARAIWERLRCPHGELRVELARARLLPPPAGIELGARCERRARRLGFRELADAASRLADEVGDGPVPEIAIFTLGGFRVELGGRALTPENWQSRKARILMKILIARHGGPVNRELILEALWPGEDPARSGSRLSVTLSTLRSVLDPGHARESDFLVGADRTTVWLVSGAAWIDVVEFLAAADRGLDAHRAGARNTGWLERAVALYRGDFLEEATYEEWALGMREQARLAYIAVLHALADHALAEARPDDAARAYLRVLELDHYDEPAHLGLVEAMITAGRHGEAHRLYGVYAARMDELGGEAVPYPHRP